MNDLQQSHLYLTYIKTFGWSVITIDGVHIFLKKFPIIGVMAKIQRPPILPYIPKLIPLLHSYHVRTISLEPSLQQSQEEINQYVKKLSLWFTCSKEPYLPTKTIIIDLHSDEQTIFKRLTEAKQRAVRRATKNTLVIKESHDLKELIAVKSKAAGFLGGMTTYGVQQLYKTFGNKQTAILLAVHPNHSTPVGGVFLIFYKTIAYYWIAGATKQGKKLFAPTLLVWEALKFSKKHGCTHFDFVGVWDERMPRQYTAWKGFTKFKEGFGGKEVYYPLVRSK